MVNRLDSGGSLDRSAVDFFSDDFVFLPQVKSVNRASS